MTTDITSSKNIHPTVTKVLNYSRELQRQQNADKDDLPTSVADAPQLRLIDVLVLLTILAIGCALLIPAWKRVQVGNEHGLLKLGLLFASLASATFSLRAWFRYRTIGQAGKRLGIGSTLSRKQNIIAKHGSTPLVGFFILFVIWLMIHMGGIRRPSRYPNTVDWLMAAQHGVIYGALLSQLFPPGLGFAVEFFERGILICGSRWLRWDQVKIENGPTAVDGIVLTYPNFFKSSTFKSLSVRISAEVRQHLPLIVHNPTH